MSRIETIEAEKQALHQNITQLRETMDEAADKGDQAAIKQCLDSLAANEQLLRSCERRLVKAADSQAEAAKAAIRSQNKQAYEVIVMEVEAACKLAREMDRIFTDMQAKLVRLHAHSDAAGKAFNVLIRQVPETQRRNCLSLAEAVGFGSSGQLGYAVENTLGNMHLFDEIAIRRDLPGFTIYDKTKTFSEFFNGNRVRTDIRDVTAKLVEQVNDSI